MARRNEHSREQLRRMAIDAVHDLVKQAGVESLSARKVASRIGYTVGTLYLVFQNLDDLILQANEETLAELESSLRAALAAEMAAKDKLYALSRAYLQFATDSHERWRLLFEHSLAEGQTLPDGYQARVTKVFDIVEQALAPLMPQASDRQLAQCARALWGGVHGICVLALTRKLDAAGEVDVAALLDCLVAPWLAGLDQGAVV